MLVSKEAKEAFHSCNGWLFCLQAVNKEETAKQNHIDTFTTQCREFSSLRRFNDHELFQCQALIERAVLVQAVVDRWCLIRREMFPVAVRLAETYCNYRAPSPNLLNKMEQLTKLRKDQVDIFVEIWEVTVDSELEARSAEEVNDQEHALQQVGEQED